MKSNVLYIKDIFNLFDEVQRKEIFDDQKKMADAIPKFDVEIINSAYQEQKDRENFSLKDFVEENFDFKEYIVSPDFETKLPIEQHIDRLWEILTRENKESEGTLIGLPKSYIVPGGRFIEFFYWDSYFVMLGLQVSGKKDLAENIVENCHYLIQQYGFVPNANRTYFLSRSQPPFFSLMVELLAEILEDESVYQKYSDSLEKEYQYWMDGSEEIEVLAPKNKLVKITQSVILNRYYDPQNTPREESYLIDIESREKSENPEFYKDVRSACESGWDFSSRWFSNPEDISTIETQHIIPVDLNCLLWHLEATLSKIFSISDTQKAAFYKTKSEQRKNAIQQYFWNEDEGLFMDYHFKKAKSTHSVNIATIYPLYFGLCTDYQAEQVAKRIDEDFLKLGGLLTTNTQSGQQWDSPNAWAPFQWIGFVAVGNYGFTDLANRIKNNWCENVERVYQNTGKLMEKYNAVDTISEAGGGEYTNQDGFGWTNGVYLKLKQS